MTLGLLGSFQFSLGNAPVPGLSSDKSRALLAFLAVEADRAHRREHLVGLLWPDCPEVKIVMTSNPAETTTKKCSYSGCGCAGGQVVTVTDEGTILYDSSVVKDPPAFRAGVHVFAVPFTEIAVDLGKAMVKNIVALGALQAATRLFPAETLRTAIRLALKDKCALIPLNEEAFSWGMRSVTPAPN